MAKSRLIRQAILGSEKVCSMSIKAQLFFFKLLLVADDFGLFDARAHILRGVLYSASLDKTSKSDIDCHLAECEKADILVCYFVDDKRYGLIRGYGQRSQSDPKHPIPDGWTPVKGANATVTHGDPPLKTVTHGDPPLKTAIDGVGDGDDKDLSLSRERVPECVERSLSPEDAAEPYKVASRVKALPRSEEEVEAYLCSQTSTRMQGEELKACALRFFDEMESSGWLDAKQRPINNWQAAARVYASRWSNNINNNNQSDRKKINNDNFDV